MPAENQQNQSNSANEYKRISMWEFFLVTKWAMGFLFKLYPVRTVVWLLTGITNNVQNILYTFIFAKALDQIIKVSQMPNASLDSLYPYLGLILLYNLLAAGLGFVGRQTSSYIRQTSRPKIRQSFYYKLHYLGIETLEQPGVNDKITRAEDNLGNIMPFLSGTVSLIASTVTMLVTISIVLSLVPLLVPLILVVSLPSILYDRHIRMKIYKVDYENTEKVRQANMNATDLMYINKIQEIATTGALKFLDKKYIDVQTWVTNIRIKINTEGRVGDYIFGFLTGLAVIYGYVQIFAKILLKTISVGNVVFYMRSLDTLERAIGDASGWFNSQFELSIQLKDTYFLFNAKPDFKDGTVVLPRLTQGPLVDFKNVSFKYPRSERYVLKNLDLKIKPGERIAIVGANGAGKTTLVKLISRFYQVTEGTISINNINVDDVTSASLYQNIGLLFQDFNMYPQLTVKENITIGRSDEPVDETRVRIAAQTSDAMEFIEAFPNKFDQVLDPRFKGGIRPSTGQWQKLAIARFFYRNAPIVIFDEPTASIDAISEYHIFNKIYDFFEGKTVIIISHRFSTVRNADRIVVLDSGKITEEGTHKTLMELNGKYAEAFLLQAKGYEQ